MVLLILAVVWAAILASWYRARRQRSYLDSVGTFRRHLNVIERVTPRRVAAANSRRAAPRYTMAGNGQPVARLSSRSRHRRSQRRRREIFFTLFGGVIGAAALWPLLPVRSVLYLQLALDVCFMTYLLLLIRARNLAADREMKIRFLQFGSGPYRGRPVVARSAPIPNYATSFDYRVPASRVRTARPAV